MSTWTVVGSLVLGLALAACGSSNNNSSSSATTSNPQLRSAESVVQGCVTKGNVLTSSGRTAILDCIAPNGHAQAFTTCAQDQLAKAQLLTSAGRKNYLAALAACLENNR